MYVLTEEPSRNNILKQIEVSSTAEYFLPDESYSNFVDINNNLDVDINICTSWLHKAGIQDRFWCLLHVINIPEGLYWTLSIITKINDFFMSRVFSCPTGEVWN